MGQRVEPRRIAHPAGSPVGGDSHASKQYDQLTSSQKKWVPVLLQVNRGLLAQQEALNPAALRAFEGGFAGPLLTTMKNVKDELKGSADAAADFATNLGDTLESDQSQGFFQRLIAAGEQILRIFTGPASRAIEGVFAILDASLPTALKLADAVGDLLNRFGDWAVRAEETGDLADAFEQAWRIASRFGKILGSIGRSLLIFTSGGRKGVFGLLGDMEKLTARFENFLNDAKDSGALEEFFAQAREDFNMVIDLLWQVGRVFASVFKGAMPAARILFSELTDFFTNIADFLASTEGQNALNDYFMEILPTLRLVGEAVVALATAWFEVSNAVRPEFQSFMRALIDEILPALTDLLIQTSQALGPSFIDFFVEFADVLSVLAGSSGPVWLLIEGLTLLFKGFNALPGPVKAVIINLAALNTIGKVFGVQFFPKMLQGFGKLFKALIGVKEGGTVAGVAMGRLRQAMAWMARTRIGEAFVSNVVVPIKGIPGKLRNALSGLKNLLTRIFRGAAASAGQTAASTAVGTMAGESAAGLPAKAAANQGKFTAVGRSIGKWMGRGIVAGVVIGLALWGDEIGDAIREEMEDVDLGPFNDAKRFLFGKRSPFAMGGPVPGTGVGDTVRALLTPGEHVWTAQEVKAAGGHGAMFAMRAVFGGGGQSGTNRFQTGGRAAAANARTPSATSRGLTDLFGSAGTMSDDLLGILDEIESRSHEVFVRFRESIENQTSRAADAARKNFEKLKAAAEKQFEKAQEAAQKNFGGMRTSANRNFKGIQETADDRLRKTARQVGKHTKKAADSFGSGMDNMAESSAGGLNSILSGTEKALNALGEKTKLPRINVTSDADKKTGKSVAGDSGQGAIYRNRGGRTSGWSRNLADGARMLGIGLTDSIPAMLAPGEVVLNRHHEAALEGATGMPGIIDSILGSVRKSHFEPFHKGGRANLAGGGYVQGAQPPHGPGSGPIRALANMLFAKGFSATSGGEYRGTGTYHDQQRAIDWGSSVNNLPALAKVLLPRKKQFAELFGPSAFMGLFHFGQKFSDAGLQAMHEDHIHTALLSALEGKLGDGTGSLLVPTIKAPKVRGGGVLGKGIQKALRRVTRAANKKIGKNVGTGAFMGASANASPGVAKIIYKVGKKMGASALAMLAAFEAALVESGMRNLNYGDADSLGVFQQRPSAGWGSPRQIMNVTYAASKFFSRAIPKSKGFSGSAGQLAQAVQVSAYPDRYDQRRAEALGWIKRASSGRVNQARGGRVGFQTGSQPAVAAGAPQKARNKAVKRLRQNLRDELSGLGADADQILKTESARVLLKIANTMKRFFKGLKDAIGSTEDLTRDNVRRISRILALGAVVRRLARQRTKDLAKDDPKTEVDERKAAIKRRDRARDAVKDIQGLLGQMADAIANGSTAVFEAFRTFLSAGKALAAGRFQSTSTSKGALAGLDKLTPEQINTFTKALNYASKAAENFFLQFKFAEADINLAKREITDLGKRMRLLEKIQNKTGTSTKKAMLQVKNAILNAAQVGIQAVNDWFDQQKGLLDDWLTTQTDQLERGRTTWLDAASKQHDDAIKVLDAQSKALEKTEKAITRTMEREARRREILVTQRGLGKLLAQEFFSMEDLDQVQALSEQLGEQLRANAEAERQYSVEDARQLIEDNRAQLDADYEDMVKQINTNFDAAIANAQVTYATSLVALNTQATDMIKNIVHRTADALGVRPARIWDYLLGAGTLARDKANDSVRQVLHEIRSHKGHFEGAGDDLMDAFAAGITAGGPKAVRALRRILRDMANYLPHSDAKIGPLADLTTSGEAMWSTFAEGMDAGAKNFEYQAPSMPAFDVLFSPAPSINSTLFSERTLKTEHYFKVDVDARGLTEAERRALINATSREVAKEFSKETLTATNNLGRSLVA